MLSSGVTENVSLSSSSFFYAGKERNAPGLLGRFFILLKWKSDSVEMRSSHLNSGRRSSCQLQEAAFFQPLSPYGEAARVDSQPGLAASQLCLHMHKAKFEYETIDVFRKVF